MYPHLTATSVQRSTLFMTRAVFCWNQQFAAEDAVPAATETLDYHQQQTLDVVYI